MCPSADQVTAALRARLPQIMGQGGSGLPSPLWLQWRGSAQAPEVQLRDADGTIVLSRVLRVQSGVADCPALAETVALIVERYLDELQLQDLAKPSALAQAMPPTADPDHTWALGARTMVRSGRAAWLPPGGELWLERLGKGGGHHPGTAGWLASLGGALGVSSGQNDRAGAARLQHLHTWLLIRAGAWRVWDAHKLGLFADVGLAAVRASRTEGPASWSAWGAEPWAGLGGRYRLSLRNRWFAEASAAVYAAVVRHELVVLRLPENERRVVAATPRIFTDLGISVGVQF